MSTKKMPKNAEKFHCEKCGFITSKQSNYNKHLLTAKHKNQQKSTKKCQKMPQHFTCQCGKKYKDRSGLWRHKKKCQILDTEKIFGENKEIIIEKKNEDEEKKVFENDSSSIKELFLVMMNENKELRNVIKTQQENYDKKISEILPKIGNNTNNNISINVFLNEHCKNAINFKDFINNIRVSLQNVVQTTELGYVEGVSNIFLENLQKLETTMRPIHCSDKKRLQFYIKDDDTWNKENGEKMEKAIDNISNKQLQEMNHKIALQDDEFCEKIPNITGPSDIVEQRKSKKEIVKRLGENLCIKDALQNV